MFLRCSSFWRIHMEAIMAAVSKEWWIASKEWWIASERSIRDSHYGFLHNSMLQRWRTNPIADITISEIRIAPNCNPHRMSAIRTTFQQFLGVLVSQFSLCIMVDYVILSRFTLRDRLPVLVSCAGTNLSSLPWNDAILQSNPLFSDLKLWLTKLERHIHSKVVHNYICLHCSAVRMKPFASLTDRSGKNVLFSRATVTLHLLACKEG